MNNLISRRRFLGTAAAAGAVSLGCSSGPAPDSAPAKRDFPIVDLHAHPNDQVPISEQVELARQRGVKLGILQHAGLAKYDYPHMISNDELLNQWIATLEPYPVYKGIQAEGLEWPSCFSKHVLARLDYALSDALTLPEPGGGFTKIWEPGLEIGDKQKWMDRYTDFHVEVMASEPIDILANPLFLPETIRGEFDPWPLRSIPVTSCPGRSSSGWPGMPGRSSPSVPTGTAGRRAPSSTRWRWPGN